METWNDWENVEEKARGWGNPTTIHTYNQTKPPISTTLQHNRKQFSHPSYHGPMQSAHSNWFGSLRGGGTGTGSTNWLWPDKAMRWDKDSRGWMRGWRWWYRTRMLVYRGRNGMRTVQQTWGCQNREMDMRVCPVSKRSKKVILGEARGP